MRVGITGTSQGCTPAQLAALRAVLKRLAPCELHHGDCVGADAEAHAIAVETGVAVVIHPPVDEAHRAFCEGARELLAAKTHFARNRAIVAAVDVLVACPVAMTPLAQGGTWYTIQHARKVGRRVLICWPDGSETEG